MPNDFYFQEIKHNIFNKSAETKVDRFAFGLCGPNGTYIEIGAHKPSRRSNTISLEQLGWKGFGIELNTRYQQHWPDGRKNHIYWEDAITFERTISILCFSEKPNLINDLSYEGEIKHMIWGYNYSHYLNKQTIFTHTHWDTQKEVVTDISNKSIIKIFGARK